MKFGVLLLPFFLFAQTNDISLQHLSIKQGFSQSTVFCIYQDSKGFMWFGTEDGLHRYDGYQFSAYTHNFFDPHSISDNTIYAIYEDHRQRLWIGTANGGLNYFDRKFEKFYAYSSNDSSGLSDNTIQVIFEDRHKNLWIGTANGGLNKLRLTNTIENARISFTHFRHQPGNKNSLNDNNVRAIYEDRQGMIWIGTNSGGLNRLNPLDQAFIHFVNDSLNASGLSNNTVTSIREDNAGHLWIGTDRGLNFFDLETNRFFKKKDYSALFQDDIITSILFQKNINGPHTIPQIWIGTLDGLKAFDKNHVQIANLQQGKNLPGGLRSNNVLSLFEDRSGIVWIGSENGGVNKFDLKSHRFKHVELSGLAENKDETHTVRAILQTHSNQEKILWLGTLHAGLVRFNPQTQQYQTYRHTPGRSSGLQSNFITVIEETAPDTIWLGTWGGGLSRIILAENPLKKAPDVKIKTYRHQPGNSSSLSNDIVQDIYADKAALQNRKNGLWIGTDNGLDFFDPKNETFTRYRHNPNDPESLSDSRIQSNCILRDRYGNLWVGTWNGLNRLSQKMIQAELPAAQKKFIHYLHSAENTNSLSDNHIISIHEDADTTRQIIWVGTHGGGLNKLVFDKNIADGSLSQTARIIRYNEENGLPDDVIYAIVDDAEGNLWLSTNYGIAKFNPATETFNNYDESDGLRNTRFFWGAAYKSPQTGEIFFGTTSGFTSFLPAHFKENNHTPPVYLTDFQIFNRSVPIGNPPLKTAISEAKAITLTYEKNVFSFEFSTLDYSHPEKNQYVYMLEGFDKDWIFSGKRRFATYTNLDPGDYVFRVKGSNRDGIWSRNEASVRLKVLPPFWKTWWFILFALLFLISAAVYVVTSRVRQLLAVERLRTRLAADLHDDIGASLSEMAILSEIISSQLGEDRAEFKKLLSKISEDARHLVDRMSDIVWLVNPRRDTLYDLILRLKDNYADVLSASDISFRSENLKALEKTSLSMEHRQNLYLIFKEGINNSIKYSHCHEIKLNAVVNGRHLEMTLHDDGVGFNMNLDGQGNGLSNMSDRATSIGGRLSIESSPGGGTTIRYVGAIA